LQRREVRLAKITEVKAELERRAAERFAQEQNDYTAKLKEREEKSLFLSKKGKKVIVIEMLEEIAQDAGPLIGPFSRGIEGDDNRGEMQDQVGEDQSKNDHRPRGDGTIRDSC